VHIEPGHLRKGYATRAFSVMEEKVRSLGLAGVGLRVFGHNVAARALYAQLGFQPTDLTLFKALGQSGGGH